MDRDLSIVYEDKALSSLDKPAGVASIPSVNTFEYDGKHLCSKAAVGKIMKISRFIVTRLDRDTSGLMLLQKHGITHARLDKQLQKND